MLHMRGGDESHLSPLPTPQPLYPYPSTPTPTPTPPPRRGADRAGTRAPRHGLADVSMTQTHVSITQSPVSPATPPRRKEEDNGLTLVTGTENSAPPPPPPPAGEGGGRGWGVVKATGIDDKQNMANLQRDDLDVASFPEKEREALTHQGKHAKSWSPQRRDVRNSWLREHGPGAAGDVPNVYLMCTLHTHTLHTHTHTHTHRSGEFRPFQNSAKAWSSPDSTNKPSPPEPPNTLGPLPVPPSLPPSLPPLYLPQPLPLFPPDSPNILGPPRQCA